MAQRVRLASKIERMQGPLPRPTGRTHIVYTTEECSASLLTAGLRGWIDALKF